MVVSLGIGCSEDSKCLYSHICALVGLCGRLGSAQTMAHSTHMWSLQYDSLKVVDF